MNEINLAPDFIDRMIDAFSRVMGVFDVPHLPFVGLAVIPVLVWIYLFFRHQQENKLAIFAIFIVGMFAVIPVFVFRHEIIRVENGLGNIFSNTILTVTLTSLWVGFYEETAKHWVVRSVGKNLFRSIDDVIIFSIVAALGFAFIENVLYFQSIWNNLAISSSMRWFYVVFRSVGSMLLHVFASGIFGYYFGIAHFAKPILREKLSKGKRPFAMKWIHQILHLKSETIFREEKILQGLLIAASIHAIFDFLMGTSQYFTDLGSSGIARIFLLAAVPFLVGGYFLLTYLLDKKEDHKIYGEVKEGGIVEED